MYLAATQTQICCICNADTDMLYQLIQLHLIKLQRRHRYHTSTKTQICCFNKIWSHCNEDTDMLYQLIQLHLITLQRRHRYHTATKTQIWWSTISDYTATKTQIFRISWYNTIRSHCNKDTDTTLQRRHRYVVSADTTTSDYTTTKTQILHCNEDTDIKLLRRHSYVDSTLSHLTATKTQICCISWYNNISHLTSPISHLASHICRCISWYNISVWHLTSHICRALSAKEPLIIGLFCGKWKHLTSYISHPTSDTRWQICIECLQLQGSFRQTTL